MYLKTRSHLICKGNFQDPLQFILLMDRFTFVHYVKHFREDFLLGKIDIMKQWKSWGIFQIQIKTRTLQRIKGTVQNILPRNSNYTTFSKKIRFAVRLEYDINSKWPTYYIRMDLVGTHGVHGVWVYTLHHLISNCAKKTNFPPIKSASLIFHEYFRGNTDLWEGIVCCIVSIITLGGSTSLWIIALFYTSVCSHSWSTPLHAAMVCHHSHSTPLHAVLMCPIHSGTLNSTEMTFLNSSAMA